MRGAIAKLRDVWCDISNRCPPNPDPNEELISILTMHREAAIESAKVTRKERKVIEEIMRESVPYHEMNRVLFGRYPWPRDGGTS